MKLLYPATTHTQIIKLYDILYKKEVEGPFTKYGIPFRRRKFMHSLLYGAATFLLTISKHFEGLVFFQVLQLAAVDGATPSLPNVLDRILVLHSALDQGQGYQDGSPPQSRNTVNGNRGAGVLLESGLQEVQPRLYDVVGRSCTVIEFPVLEERESFIVLNFSAYKLWMKFAFFGPWHIDRGTPRCRHTREPGQIKDQIVYVKCV